MQLLGHHYVGQFNARHGRTGSDPVFIVPAVSVRLILTHHRRLQVMIVTHTSALTNRFCSWCFSRSHHGLEEGNLLRRSIFKCGKCQNRTVECRYCNHMARGSADGWDDELCAEHSNEVASFSRLDLQLDDLSQFATIFQRDSLNLKSVGITAACTIAGCAVLGPAALYAGPALASSLGAAGILGAAGTGTAISSLSGAALASASLAAIGGGTMAAGGAVITATGAALGGYYGGMISNSYFGEVENFRINKVHGGNKHAVVFVNGFMSEGSQSVGDWTSGLKHKFRRNHWYHLDWEARNLAKLGATLQIAPRALAQSYGIRMAARATKSAASKVNPIGAAMTVADVVNNPWHRSMVKAQMTGVMLADAIARTPKWSFTLAGHSLGARVIYYALEALSTKRIKRINDVYLLGGAVSNSNKDWEHAASGIRGTIYNCHSDNDSVLKYLYRGANAGLSTPIGYKPIDSRYASIHNLDCTAIVKGHLTWKDAIPDILWSLHG